MSYRLRITIRNASGQQRRVVVYGGTVFEVQDPFSRVQNLVATEDSVLVMGPGQSEAIEIDTWCLNRSFSSPSNTPMRPTVLRTGDLYQSQSELWDAMSRLR